MQEIEDKIEKRIVEVGDDQLMSLWLELLEKKKEASERLVERLEKKDPVLTGALIGAAIGNLFA